MENPRLNQLFTFLNRAPRDSFTLYSIGLEYLQSGQFVQARTYLERVLEYDPDYLGTYYQLGRCLRLLEDDETAISVYQQGMEKALGQSRQHIYAELQNALMNTEIGEDP